MNDTKSKKVVKAYVSDETYTYIMSLSDNMGVSISGLINLFINTYKQQNEVVGAMSKFDEYLTRLEKINSKGDKS